MNRKQFLGSATLLAALAFGKKSLAARAQEERWSYYSDRVKIKNTLYEFDIKIDAEDYDDNDLVHRIPIGHSVYEDMDVEDDDPSKRGMSLFERKGRVKKTKDGSIMELKAYELSDRVPNNFYSAVTKILISEDKKSASFELGSGKKIDLRFIDIYSPIKSSDDDMDCFLTTACIRAKQLPDDCTELTALRNFRDTALIATSEGKNLVKKYYNIAPQIVQEINTYSNSTEIWTLLYDELVQGTVSLIDDNKAADAVSLYSSYVHLLEKNVLAKN